MADNSHNIIYTAFKAAEEKELIMSKIINMVSIDTAISGVTAPSLTLPVLNYDSDFRLKTSSNANEVVMVNTTTGLDEDEQIRIAFNEIADIYKNSGISCDNVSSSKTGYSLLVQLTKTVQLTDNADATFSAHVPISVHMVIKVPKIEAITNDTIKILVSRLFAALYEGGTLKALGMLKGAISPKGL